MPAFGKLDRSSSLGPLKGAPSNGGVKEWFAKVCIPTVLKALRDKEGRQGVAKWRDEARRMTGLDRQLLFIFVLTSFFFFFLLAFNRDTRLRGLLQ
mmetsp:Transcript_7189/g.18628  ORF Transcript_7189/g.18628 Transcript_7189/m.18628 type:complete len:96 (+) Transcript_7189:200-487(+)